MADFPVTRELMRLARLFEAAGATLYAVGGMTRGPLTGLPVTDIDTCSRLTPEEVLSLCRKEGFTAVEKGIRFGTVEIHVPGENGEKLITEHTTFRRDVYGAGGTHRPEAVTFSDSLLQDAFRRDFTVNAIYLNILTGELSDPTGGLHDIRHRILRATTPDPRIILNDDALRILRLVRFRARLGFTIDPATFSAARECSVNLRDIAWERRQKELFQILAAEREPLFSALSDLYELHALEHLLPELLEGDGIEQRKEYHRYTVLFHNLHTCAEAENELALRLAALLHDVGKPMALRESAKLGTPNMHRHEVYSEEIAHTMLLRLRTPKALMGEVLPLIRCHMYDLDGRAKESTLREFFALHGKEFSRRLCLIREADVHGSGIETGAVASSERWRAILQRMEAEGAPFSERELACTGADLMEWMNVSGAEVGRLKESLLRHCARHPKDNTCDRLRKIAKGFVTRPPKVRK